MTNKHWAQIHSDMPAKLGFGDVPGQGGIPEPGEPQLSEYEKQRRLERNIPLWLSREEAKNFCTAPKILFDFKAIQDEIRKAAAEELENR